MAVLCYFSVTLPVERNTAAAFFFAERIPHDRNGLHWCLVALVLTRFWGKENNVGKERECRERACTERCETVELEVRLVDSRVKILDSVSVWLSVMSGSLSLSPFLSLLRSVSFSLSYALSPSLSPTLFHFHFWPWLCFVSVSILSGSPLMLSFLSPCDSFSVILSDLIPFT